VIEGYNPMRGADVDDDFEQLHVLRETCPIGFVDGMYFVTRAEDVDRIGRDFKTFGQCSFAPTVDEKLGGNPRSDDLKQLGETDRPVHTEFRRHIASALTNTAVQNYKPVIERVGAALLDAFPPDEVDFVAAFALEFPARVIAELAGLPLQLASRVRAYATDMTSTLDPEVADEVATEAKARRDQFDQEVLEFILDVRANGQVPGVLLHHLLEARNADGSSPSDARLMTAFTKDLVFGGTDTTAHLLGNLLYQVLSVPGLYQEIRADRSLVPATVEESLRHLSPVSFTHRMALHDVKVGDTEIPRGSVLMLALGSANRDEARFPDSDRFDIRRKNLNHFAFNKGIHLCVGAPLVRIEAITGLNLILDRYTGMALAPDAAYKRVSFYFMRGPRSLQVRLTP